MAKEVSRTLLCAICQSVNSSSGHPLPPSSWPLHGVWTMQGQELDLGHVYIMYFPYNIVPNNASN